MRQWYRSGFEAYCKAAAQVMGLPANNSGWGNFGRDLFADGRFDDPAKASKTWVLSRYRAQGRSNRPKLFEESWLGKNGRDCELEAIHTCVHSMCSKTDESTLYELYLSSPDMFATDFHNVVLPAIEEGFEAERYHSSDIACFVQSMDRALLKLDISFPQTFRNFAIPLVAGLIYGPGHDAARLGSSSVTLRGLEDEDVLPPIDIDMRAVILTQLFSRDLGLVGYSGTYGEENVILLGRGLDADDFLDVCGDDLAKSYEGKYPISFPIANIHRSTSRAHGIIMREGDTWYYYDFSTNGSFIESADRSSAACKGAAALAPGDRIYLGISEFPEDDDEAFRLGAVILVSFKVDETHLMESD